jgi:putative membrane protein
MSRDLNRCVIAPALSVALMAFVPQPLLAHTTRALSPDGIWSAWTFEPAVVALLALSAGLYVLGIVRMWAASEVGAGVQIWRASLFGFGWVVLGLALLSPLHALGGALFSAHMTQHEMLISIAAPLLVLGRPFVPFLWALPAKWRRHLAEWTHTSAVRRSWSVISLPSVAFALHAVALWAWHLPGPYQATLSSDVAHSLQHASFIFTALLFWWTIFGVQGGELARGRAILYLFATALQTGALGALLTFAQTLWYPAYAATTTAWGLTALEDQQLGGLIMWIPGSLAYLVAALAIFSEWLREAERRSIIRERAIFVARSVTLVAAAAVALSCDRASGDNARMLTKADADRGRVAIKKYGCGSCHTIPGISGAQGLVGPPLGQIASRVYIAGVLPNEPDNMIRWIENPPAIDSKTAMPNMGVTARDARDIATYLYTLR